MQFIHEDTLSDLSICDELISAFHKGAADGHAYPGISGKGVDTTWKKSTDMPLPLDMAEKYYTELRSIAKRYISKFPAVDEYSKWGFAEGSNIQHYAPGEGFYAWHTERSSAQYPCCARILVFMTYLNDVHDGGGTEFLYQNMTTTARKGKTLIWPADWTHTHRGQVSPTEDKYIVTGWFSYLE